MGTILIYLLSPVIITAVGWKGVFVFSAVCGTVMLITWNRLAVDVPAAGKQTRPKAQGSSHSLFTPLMLSVMVAIILQGMLRDGVTTWMPSFISETYDLGSAISILTGVLLPVFGIACFQLATWLYQRHLQNPLLCAGALFAAGSVFAFALYLCAESSAAGSVLFSAALTGCMHGVNLILICVLPPFFQKTGNISTVSGVLNACTYIGSAISTYGIATLSENIGWRNTIFLWFLIAAVGGVICLLCVKPWSRQLTE